MKVLHGDSGEDRSDVLDWFRQSGGPVVLVSVNMLAEGVDLPDARTALLACPTASRIRLRQMIGRVLRGPASGGDPDAHIVYLQDVWANFADILEPADVVEGEHEERVQDRPGLDHAWKPLSGLPGSAVAEASRQFAAASQRDQKIRIEKGWANTVVDAAMIGYYDLADRQVPVFDHQQTAWQETIDASAENMGASLLSAFDDIPDPRPSRRIVEAVVSYCREQGKPPYRPVDPTTTPAAVAAQLDDGMARTSAGREEMIRKLWSESLARRQYPDFEQFADAVKDAEARRYHPRISEEQPPDRPNAGDRRKLRRMTGRQLDGNRERVLDWAATDANLPPTLVGRLWRPAVNIKWSKRLSRSQLAYWTAGLKGRVAQPWIVVNVLYQTDRKAVTDEMLEYLIWHEVVHHLLPLHGHDRLFRELEQRWPHAASLDAQWDKLGDRIQPRPRGLSILTGNCSRTWAWRPARAPSIV